MTSWHDKAFLVTGPLCKESTGHRWFPLTSIREPWCFFDVNLSKLLKNSRVPGNLRRYEAHYTSLRWNIKINMYTRAALKSLTNEVLVLSGQYHRRWWPADAMSQGAWSRDTALVCQESLAWQRVKQLLRMLIMQFKLIYIMGYLLMLFKK